MYIDQTNKLRGNQQSKFTFKLIIHEVQIWSVLRPYMVRFNFAKVGSVYVYMKPQ